MYPNLRDDENRDVAIEIRTYCACKPISRILYQSTGFYEQTKNRTKISDEHLKVYCMDRLCMSLFAVIS